MLEQTPRLCNSALYLTTVPETLSLLGTVRRLLWIPGAK